MNRSILFIDESGTSSLLKESKEPFILTGVILEDREVNIIEGFFNYIKLKYSINVNEPFHSFNVFEDSNTKLPTAKAKDLITKLSDFISFIPIKLRILSVDRSMFRNALGVKSLEDFKFDSKRKELKDFPYRIMASHLFKWFAEHLESEGSIGEIVVDAKKGGDAQLIKTLYLCKDCLDVFDDSTRNLIRKKCTSICFAEKYCLSGGLEIADIISFTAFQHARRSMPAFKEIRLNKVWNEVRDRLPEKSLERLSEEDVRCFFKIEKDGVHKYLRNLSKTLGTPPNGG